MNFLYEEVIFLYEEFLNSHPSVESSLDNLKKVPEIKGNVYDIVLVLSYFFDTFCERPFTLIFGV